MNLKRRDFLLASAAGSMAMAQSGDKVATGMIGVGGRGSYLLSGVKEQPNARVVALCDIKPDRLDKAASSSARDNPTTYTDWRKVIDRKDVEAVYIATPPHLHSEMAVAALKAGKHVYCEKPLGVNAAQVRELVKAAKDSKKVFTVGHQMRSLKQMGTAIRKIHEGAIGDVLMVKAQRHANSDLAHDGTSGDWYFDVSKSGGYLIEQSVHNLDVCNWAIGAHPLRASGFGGLKMFKNDPPGRSIFDSSIVTYEYPNGIRMSFTQNVYHPRTLPGAGQYVYVYGTKGAVDLMPAFMFHPHGRDQQPSEFAEKQTENPYAHIVGFYDAVTKGTPPPADITIGATASLTAILGHEAMVKETVVKWSDLGVGV